MRLNESGPILGRRTRVFCGVLGGGLLIASPIAFFFFPIGHTVWMFSTGLLALYCAYSGRDQVDPRPPEVLGPQYRAALTPGEASALIIFAVFILGFILFVIFGFR